MIIRVFRYSVHDGAGAVFDRVLAEEALPALACRPGLRFTLVGRDPGDACRGVAVTGWEAFEDLDGAVAHRLDEPGFLPTHRRSLLRAVELSHWEAVDLPPVATSERASLLRLTRGSLDPRHEGRLVQFLRDEAWPARSGTPGIAGGWIGRQLDGGDERFLAVTLWRSAEDLEADAVSIGSPTFVASVAPLIRDLRSEVFQLVARLPVLPEAPGVGVGGTVPVLAPATAGFPA